MRIFHFFKKRIPVHILGIFPYVLSWARSKGENKIYTNPYFNKATPKNNQIAIYCIHGTADRTSAFEPFIKKILKKNELPNNISSFNIVAFPNRGEGRSISFFSKKLLERIQKDGHQNIVLIGHSRGGLVAAHFTEYLAKNASIKVSKVITIGTPFKGSPLANSFLLRSLSTSIKEMQPECSFLQGLSARIIQSKIPYQHFAAGKDVFVALESTYPEKRKSKKLSILSEHGHLSIMRSTKLANYVQNLLVRTSKLNAETSNNLLFTKKIKTSKNYV